MFAKYMDIFCLLSLLFYYEKLVKEIIEQNFDVQKAFGNMIHGMKIYKETKKCNFPMTPDVHWLVGWLVGRLFCVIIH